MSNKGTLRIASITGDGVNYQDRELSAQSGNTAGVYLDGTLVNFAREDLDNVSATSVRSKLAAELNTIANDITTLQAGVSGVSSAVSKKKQQIIGLVAPYPNPIISIEDGTLNVTINTFTWFDGTDTHIHSSETFTVSSTYAGKAVHFGLNAQGAAICGETAYGIYLYLGDCFVNADETMYNIDLIQSPSLVGSTYYERALPPQLYNFNFKIVNGSGNSKIFNTDAYEILKEGINYSVQNRPNSILIEAQDPVVFKYIYPNYINTEASLYTVFSANKYYDLTDGELKNVPVGKYAVYRVGVLENGDCFLLCQSANSSDDLFSSLETLRLNASQIIWNTNGISNRIILTDYYLWAFSADTSGVVSDCDTYFIQGSVNSITYNISNSIVGSVSTYANLPTTAASFTSAFGVDPYSGQVVLVLADENVSDSGSFGVPYTMQSLQKVSVNDDIISYQMLTSFPVSLATIGQIGCAWFYDGYVETGSSSTTSLRNLQWHLGKSVFSQLRVGTPYGSSFVKDLVPYDIQNGFLITSANQVLPFSLSATEWAALKNAPDSDTQTGPWFNTPNSYVPIAQKILYSTTSSSNQQITIYSTKGCSMHEIYWAGSGLFTISLGGFFSFNPTPSSLRPNRTETYEFLIKTTVGNAVTIQFENNLFGSYGFANNWVDGSGGALDSACQYHLVTLRYHKGQAFNGYLANIEAEWNVA